MKNEWLALRGQSISSLTYSLSAIHYQLLAFIKDIKELYHEQDL